MPSTFEFCLPTAAKAVPDGPDWFHEIKYDGYRLRVERNGRSARLITRNGHNWTDRFAWIVQSALRSREQQFVIDGEAVVLGVDGVSHFDALHCAGTTRRCSSTRSISSRSAARICGSCRWRYASPNLARLLRGRPDGMFVAPFESGAIGPDLFRAACDLRLKGIVSKRRDRRYIAGRTREWVKVKNRTHPAKSREF
ncbi:DNA ligase [Bradyrhizobium huanghuaihaiense]|uniref:ATP-dependent DNA ligase n=1 Tax=Bradyrhizobium huanghuaihaiense TaxID=990078 RepID=UPI00288BD160|nr:DNA ligase [Bradyrhizobium sp. CB3035]